MKYFLHDSNAFNDEKVTQLFIKFGYEGVGLFYTILEKLAQQEKPILTEVLKHQLKVGKKLTKVWKFIEEIELISSNNGETFSKQLLNFSQKYQIKKEKNAKRISQWRENQKDCKNVTCNKSVRNTPKVNRSKIKLNKDIYKEFDFFKNDFKDIWIKEFIPLKKKKKGSLTDRALTDQLNTIKKLSNNNYSVALEILKKSVNSGWTDFYELKNNNNGQSGSDIKGNNAGKYNSGKDKDYSSGL